MQFYDLSRPLTPRSAVFPGDTPVSLTHNLLLRQGDACNLSSITLSVHAGTHVDAPRHNSDAGPGIDRIPLDVLIGRARVVTLPVTNAITLADVQALDLAGVTRLLVHTRDSDVPDDVFDHDLVFFTPDAAAWLGDQGVRLIGTDAPSVDPVSSADLAAHRAFLRGAVVIVENLCLRAVPDGDYEVMALPLCIAESDGAPARVVLRTLTL
ncbi:MAG: cyclase family protein [Anaerolineae bacterium]